MNRLKAVLVVVALATAVGSLHFAVVAQEQETPEAINAKIRKLQQQRVDVDLRADHHRAG